jgi:hypothetical protein
MISTIKLLEFIFTMTPQINLTLNYNTLAQIQDFLNECLAEYICLGSKGGKFV